MGDGAPHDECPLDREGGSVTFFCYADVCSILMALLASYRPKTGVSIIIVQNHLCAEVLEKVNTLFFDGESSKGFDKQVQNLLLLPAALLGVQFRFIRLLSIRKYILEDVVAYAPVMIIMGC